MNNKECPLEIRANLYVEQFNGDLKHICLKKSRNDRSEEQVNCNGMGRQSSHFEVTTN